MFLLSWRSKLGAHAIASLLLVSSMMTAGAAPGPKHILPDEAAKDMSFLQFRTRLLEAAKSKNKAFLEMVLSEDIIIGLGVGKGKEDFMDEWQGLSANSLFWQRLIRILEHGSEYDNESQEFHSPAVSFADNHVNLPQAVAWNKRSTLYKSPDLNSKALRVVHGEQLTITQPPDKLPVKQPWVKVKCNDGLAGFMRSDDIYSAFDEFAMFKKLKGKWQLVWFGYATY